MQISSLIYIKSQISFKMLTYNRIRQLALVFYSISVAILTLNTQTESFAISRFFLDRQQLFYVTPM